MSKSSLYTDGKFIEYDQDEDGNVRMPCSTCKEVKDLTGKQAEMAVSDPSRYLCLTCWKKNKDKERENGQRDTQDRIAYAQSWNLAIASLADEDKKSLDFIKEEASRRQAYFYEQLTNRNNG